MQSEPFKITATSHLHLRRVIRGGINRFLKILEFITLSEKHLCVSGTQTNARVLFPLWSHFSFSLCLSDIKSDVTVRTRLGAHNSGSPLQSPWDKIRRVSLNLILPLSLFCVSLFLFPCLSFFSFFLSKGEHPHKPPLPHTFPHLAWQFPQLSRNRLSDIDTEGEPASKRLNFSPRLFFFFFAVSFWCIQPSRPYHLAPSPPVCVFTPKGQGVCSLVIVGVKCQGCVARQTEVFQRHTSNYGVWELSLPLWCIAAPLLL